MTIQEALGAATERLRAAGCDTPRLDAEVLLRFLLGWDRARLLAAFPDSVSPAVVAQYMALVDARIAGAPVAYLVGEREFMGRRFAIGPGVLVPRPETEIMVESIIERVRAEPRWSDRVAIVDVGTGSGAISLSLALALPQASVIGVERSAQALAYARVNRAALGLWSRVSLVQGDLLAPVACADVVAANLPYLRPEQLHAGIAREPVEALVGGADGLDLYRALLPQAAVRLARPGLLALEIDPSQSASLPALCRTHFPDASITLVRDLAGLDRIVMVQR